MTKQQVDAHAAVRQAIRAKRLLRRPCCICGKKNGVRAHHENYGQPLNVIWLCTIHHGLLHQDHPILSDEEYMSKVQEIMESARKRENANRSRRMAKSGIGTIIGTRITWLKEEYAHLPERVA